MINEALRLIRVFHDLKQVELAKKLGVSKSHISEIEKGVKTPSLDLIQRYAVSLHLPISSIMFFAEELPQAMAGDRVALRLRAKLLTSCGSSRGKRMTKTRPRGNYGLKDSPFFRLRSRKKLADLLRVSKETLATLAADNDLYVRRWKHKKLDRWLKAEPQEEESQELSSD